MLNLLFSGWKEKGDSNITKGTQIFFFSFSFLELHSTVLSRGLWKGLKVKGRKINRMIEAVSIIVLWSSMNRLKVQLRSMKILADAKRPAARICVFVQELNSYQQLENFKNLGSDGIVLWKKEWEMFLKWLDLWTCKRMFSTDSRPLCI